MIAASNILTSEKKKIFFYFFGPNIELPISNQQLYL
jgi:hypothetical protein